MAGTFGDITNPLDKVGSGGYGDISTGLPAFISNLLKVVFIAGGLYAFFNLLFAGFIYITAAGDKQKIEKALYSINMSLLGLIIMVASGLIMGIISFLLFGSATAILKPKIVGPGTP
ncbi:MAG: hypothetical protein UY18_C0002G0040 [Microgenomates group bacterium GW2011_GWF2_47_9]|nr:MAG: hypothetical protein UY18_C0002G0040 [Microgenomates group bacterium GW2011_GWF2_47_9]